MLPIGIHKGTLSGDLAGAIDALGPKGTRIWALNTPGQKREKVLPLLRASILTRSILFSSYSLTD